MSKNEWKKLVGVAGRLLLVFVFVFSQTAWAGQSQQTKDKSQSPQKAATQQTGEKQSSGATAAKAQGNQPQGEESEGPIAEEKSSGDGRHESIKVHGHWTIEVRSLDGTLVRHVEFENSLAPAVSFTVGSQTGYISGGADYLAALLAGRAATPIWFINLFGPGIGPSNPYPASTANSPCVQPGAGGYAACAIDLPSATSCPPSAPPVGVGCNLSVSTLGAPPSSVGPIQLSGSVAATQSGQVSTVVTAIGTPCGGVTNCAVSNGSVLFTSSSNFPGAPITVTSGQIIAVTVVISFS